MPPPPYLFHLLAKPQCPRLNRAGGTFVLFGGVLSRMSIVAHRAQVKPLEHPIEKIFVRK